MKAIFIDDIGSNDVKMNPDNYVQYAAINWAQCFSEPCRFAIWQTASVEDCQQYDFAFIKLLADPNVKRLNKILELVSAPDKKYKTIISIDEVVGWQLNQFSVENKILYTRILKNADFIIHFNLPESEEYFDALCQGTPHANIVRPFPIKLGKEIANQPFEQKDGERQRFIALDKGLKNSGTDRNAFSSLAVVRNLQRINNYSVMAFTCQYDCGGEAAKLYKEISGVENVVEIPSLNWIDYMRALRVAEIAVHLDDLETLGQFALNCACLRIPLVCSGSVCGKELFPFTFVKHCRDIRTARGLADALISDEKFRSCVVDFAFNAVEQFSVEKTKTELGNFLNCKI